MMQEFDLIEAAGHLCHWNGEEVKARFEGRGIATWEAEIDGVTLAVRDEVHPENKPVSLAFVDRAGFQVATVAFEATALVDRPAIRPDSIVLSLAGVEIVISRREGPVTLSRRDRADAAARIDPHTAHAFIAHGSLLDPYGDGHIPREERVWARIRWMVDPDGGRWITEYDVRRHHLDISSAEWNQLYRDALVRGQEEGEDVDDF